MRNDTVSNLFQLGPDRSGMVDDSVSGPEESSQHFTVCFATKCDVLDR
jgi:hypothetical protein